MWVHFSNDVNGSDHLVWFKQSSRYHSVYRFQKTLADEIQLFRSIFDLDRSERDLVCRFTNIRRTTYIFGIQIL